MNLVFRYGSSYESRRIIEDTDRIELFNAIRNKPGVHIKETHLIDFDNYETFIRILKLWDDYYGDRNRPHGHEHCCW